MILLIDNYDSFVFNLARYFERLGQATIVRRNDAVTVRDVESLRPDAIVLSPGPGAPAEAGCSVDVVRRLHASYPILGVCLGHQAIAAALGAAVVRSPEPMHGRASMIEHDASGVFQGLANPFSACRYHSLAVDESSLPAELAVSARTRDGIVMAIQHRRLPVVGVQFHPESILTELGYPLLANFLHLAGCPSPLDPPTIADERPDPPKREPSASPAPLTF